MASYYGPITRDAKPGCSLLSGFRLKNTDNVFLPGDGVLTTVMILEGVH